MLPGYQSVRGIFGNPQDPLAGFVYGTAFVGSCSVTPPHDRIIQVLYDIYIHIDPPGLSTGCEHHNGTYLEESDSFRSTQHSMEDIHTPSLHSLCRRISCVAPSRPLYLRYIWKSWSAVQKTWISSAFIIAAMIPTTLVSLDDAINLMNLCQQY
ncbi:hypothetical protein DICSQDRAFT_140209, partial [Dichomitus squalens LYAD-421 SS1]